MAMKRRRGSPYPGKPRVEPVPRAMLHPQSAERLRAVPQQTCSGVTFRMSWRFVSELLRETENLRPEEVVDAFVMDDDGIQVYVRTEGRH